MNTDDAYSYVKRGAFELSWHNPFAHTSTARCTCTLHTNTRTRFVFGWVWLCMPVCLCASQFQLHERPVRGMFRLNRWTPFTKTRMIFTKTHKTWIMNTNTHRGTCTVPSAQCTPEPVPVWLINYNKRKECRKRVDIARSQRLLCTLYSVPRCMRNQ